MTLQFDFAGKAAIVTGAGGGIGRATALRLATAGAMVACADISTDAGEETANLITSAGGVSMFVNCDVGNAQSIEATIADTVATFGRLDLAFNNAGILGPMGKTITEISEAEWASTINVNLTSVWRCMKQQIPAMLVNSCGAIVNMASVAGLIGAPRNPVYGAAKHGVVGLTRSAALQYAARGIRINAICPGVIDTGFSDASLRQGDMPAFPLPFLPIGRAGTAEEIAGLVLWLLSEAASYMVGEAVGVDGGWRSM